MQFQYRNNSSVTLFKAVPKRIGRFLRNVSGPASIISLFLLISSCQKFVQVAPPISQVNSEQVFNNDASATAAVVGLYSQMMSRNLYFGNGAMTLYTGLTGDELKGTSPNSNIAAFANNAIPATSNTIQHDIWGMAYAYIYQVNACLEGLFQSTTLDTTTKMQLTGELKFVRAFCYFYLTNLFGDVPLELGTRYKTNEKISRTPQAQVYEQIIADLQDAQKLLDPVYIAAGPTRPDKWAVTALLARVYLYQSQWHNAALAATVVINSGNYSLVSDLNKVFLANSPEAIWQLTPVIPSINTSEGATFIPSNGLRPIYAVTDHLLNAFEPGDQRKTAWTHSTVIGGQTYSYPFKYKVRSGRPVTEYYMMLRLAEQYLIRAEAEAELNDLSDAITDLNTIRNRAGLPNTTAVTQAQILSAIQHERQVELFCEWGHRWFDLKRTGDIDAVLGAEKAGWSPTDSLYPIPFSEIQANPFLTQNVGY